MSQSQQLINLPRDMLVTILNILPIPDLIHILMTNSQLKTKFYPIFADKIEDFQLTSEAIKPAIESYFKNSSLILNISKHCLKNLILLDKTLSDFMGLEHMPKYSDQVLYTGGLLYGWWDTYFDLVLDFNTKSENPVALNQDIANLINVRPSTLMTLNDFFNALNHINTQQYNGYINLEAQTKLVQ